MKLHYLTLFLLFVLGSVVNTCELYSDEELNEDDDYDLPLDYESWSAQEKYEQLQDLISRYPKPTEWTLPDTEQKIIDRDNNLTFDIIQDESPIQDAATGEKRDKIVHQVGLTSGIIWESVGDHKYTGLFKGSNNAIWRFSPIDRQDEGHFTVSFGIKGLRDGQPSGNLFFVFSMEGQRANTNPFWNDYSNHPPKPKTLPNILASFVDVTDFITMMGIARFAEYDENGNKEENVKFPFRVILHPTKQARYTIPNDLDISPDDNFFIHQMNGLFFEHVFDVYGEHEPLADPVLIGRIKMRTPFETSSYGDKRLFFSHGRFEEDLEYYPEWEDKAHEIVMAQEQIEYFLRPNLEYNH